jgi:hypothetical protein
MPEIDGKQKFIDGFSKDCEVLTFCQVVHKDLLDIHSYHLPYQ